jgi:hypothetical protein
MLKGLAFEFNLEAILDHLHMPGCIVVARMMLSRVSRFILVLKKEQFEDQVTFICTPRHIANSRILLVRRGAVACCRCIRSCRLGPRRYTRLSIHRCIDHRVYRLGPTFSCLFHMLPYGACYKGLSARRLPRYKLACVPRKVSLDLLSPASNTAKPRGATLFISRFSFHTSQANSAMSTTNDFNNLTQKGGWREAQQVLADYYASTVQSFLTRSHVLDLQPQTVVDHGGDLLGIGLSYADLSRSSSQASVVQKHFKCFQCLLCLSYLAFIRSKGIPDAEIDHALARLSPTGLNQGRRRRLVKQAVKINQTIVKIAHTCNWHIYRATEVFFLCKCKNSPSNIM